MALKKLSKSYGTSYAGLNASLRDMQGQPARCYGLPDGRLPIQIGGVTLNSSGGFEVYVEDAKLYQVVIYGATPGVVMLTDLNLEVDDAASSILVSSAQELAGATSIVTSTSTGTLWSATREVTPDDFGFQPSVSIYRGGLPVGSPPSGSVGNDGALTLGTATTIVYSGGVYWYFGAGQLFSGSIAGFYFTVMSSTTSGVVYNNLYNPLTGLPSIPASPTPIVAAGPGAFTGPSSAVSVITRTIPAGSLGNNGLIEAHLIGSHNNSAGNKIYVLQFSGVQIFSSAATTSQAFTLPRYILQNRGSEGRQLVSSAAVVAASSAPVIQTTVDTTTDQTYSILLQKAVSTDFMVLEVANLMLDRGA